MEFVNAYRLLTGNLRLQVYVDTVGDADKYRIKLTERFPSIKFVVAKKADSLYPVVSGASIVAKVNFKSIDHLTFNLHVLQPKLVKMDKFY